MDEPGFFASTRICIVGLGLMGGSLALALQGKCAAILGVDPNLKTRELALQLGVVDQVAAHISELLIQSDLLILAAPVNAIIQIIKELPDQYPGSAVVIDMGSTKKQIVETMQALPERFEPLGGHPMCGKERSSLKYADASLFQGAPFAFTPLERTSNRARQIGEQLALAVGACSMWLDTETHDRWVAATSHLPYLLANTLAAVTPLEAAPLLGTGFRSTARLSVSNMDMMLDILSTNRDEILSDLRAYRTQLEQVEKMLADKEFESLRDYLDQGAKRYDQLIEDRGGT
jgi:prephenate dehydrogenase